MKRIRLFFKKAAHILRRLMTPKPGLSQGRIKTYEACPLKYKIQYVVGAGMEPSSALSMGSSVHQALHQIYRQKLLDKMTRESLAQILDKQWEPEGFRDIKEESDFKKRALEMLWRYVSDARRRPSKIIFLEKGISGTLGGYSVGGILDRVDEMEDGSYEIIDYKTGERELDDASAAQDIQARLYLVLTNQVWPGKVRRFTFYYLSSGNRVSVEYNTEMEKDLIAQVQEAGEGIGDGAFEPRPGPLCGWCDFFSICPAWHVSRKKFGLKNQTLFRKSGEEGHMRLSYSKMSMFQMCPREYRMLYVERRGLKPKHFFSLGLTVHESLEDFYQYEGFEKQPSLSHLLGLYEKRWISKGWPSPEEERKTFEEGRQWLTRYYGKFIDGKFLPAWAAEPYFELPVGDGHTMIGFIDRIEKRPDGTYEVIDYKTDPKLRSQKEVDEDLQLTIYHWALKENFGITPKSLSLDFIRFNERVTTKRNDEDIARLKAKVNGVAHQMLESQKRLILAYQERLRQEGVSGEEIEISPQYTTQDFQRLFLLVRRLSREKNGAGQKLLADLEAASEEIFPATINKYCAGCDFLPGCPRENEIRSRPDLLMHALEEKESFTGEESA